MKLSRAVWAEINLDHLAHNMREVRRVTNKNAKVSAVIKADGYGHGALSIGKTLLENGANRFAVATLSEALQLRKEFVDTEIMILGHTPNNQAKEIIRDDLGDETYNSIIDLSEPVAAASIAQVHKAKINDDGTIYTVLAVVKNAGRLFPYISTIIIAVGILLHLIQRIRSRNV